MTKCFLAMVLLSTHSCVDHELPEIIDCSKAVINLQLISKHDLTSCKSSEGSFEVHASGNTNTRYDYSINRVDYKETGLFTDLISGDYIVTARDVNGCTTHLRISLRNFDSDLSATITSVPDSECFSDNGQVSVAVFGGSPPYRLSLNNTPPVEETSFKNLRAGLHNLRVADAASCTLLIAFEIPRVLTGISFKNDIKPIIDTRCAKSGCHIAGSGRVDFTIFNNIKEHSDKIKLYTQTFRMPQDGILSIEQIQEIACWVDDGALNN